MQDALLQATDFYPETADFFSFRFGFSSFSGKKGVCGKTLQGKYGKDNKAV